MIMHELNAFFEKAKILKRLEILHHYLNTSSDQRH